MKGLISIQNGDFSNLNGEDYLWNLFFIKTKFKTRLKKMNGEISIQNPEWRFLHPGMDMFFLSKVFFSNKVPKTFGK